LILDAESGRSYEAFTTVVPIDGESEQYVIFTAHDVSTLKVVNRVRSNFISMVSHELRTPLNSVHGFIDLLLQGHMGLLTEEQHTYLSYAQESTQQLVSIVEDILFLTRSDLGQFEIKPQEVVLHGLAVQVMSSFQSQAHKAGVILSQDIPASSLPLHVDPQRIKQLLNNLVANAIKFTPPGGTVTIRAQHFNESYEMISVVDTGYGIPAEEYSYVFERFYQSNHRLQSKVGGWGLGLAIAKLIVEQHGGNIVLDSLANEGSTFFFTLPVHKDSGKNSS
jgi:two-component system phosphate regulon sensor histidine kinase PhoR